MPTFDNAFTIGDWALASLLVVFSACLQGISGVGFGMVAAPLLALLRPDLVPGPMLVLGIVIAALAVAREPQDLDRRGLWFALAGRLPTSIAAAMAMGLMPLRTLSLLFAAIILLGVVLAALRISLKPTGENLFAAGLLSGFMGTMTSVGLPPVALLYSQSPPATLRATIGGYLAVGSLISMVALGAVGRFGLHDLLLGLWLLAPLLLGYWLSGPLARRLPKDTARVLTLAFSALAALLLAGRQFI